MLLKILKKATSKRKTKKKKMIIVKSLASFERFSKKFVFHQFFLYTFCFQIEVKNFKLLSIFGHKHYYTFEMELSVYKISSFFLCCYILVVI